MEFVKTNGEFKPAGPNKLLKEILLEGYKNLTWDEYIQNVLVANQRPSLNVSFVVTQVLLINIEVVELSAEGINISEYQAPTPRSPSASKMDRLYETIVLYSIEGKEYGGMYSKEDMCSVLRGYDEGFAPVLENRVSVASSQGEENKADRMIAPIKKLGNGLASHNYDQNTASPDWQIPPSPITVTYPHQYTCSLLGSGDNKEDKREDKGYGVCKVEREDAYPPQDQLNVRRCCCCGCNCCIFGCGCCGQSEDP